ncbi:MAG TPA: tetratricopeptide repeat-containing protein, partial [Steroidobacteraceae bacterium]|nr:tetratricopeptide repeat-containing protein [Steroidobacteraceae bacterium]
MRLETIAATTADLLKGELHDPMPADLAAAVRSIADSLTVPGSAPSAFEVRNAMRKLNSLRRFEHARTVGGAWRDTRGCDPTIQKYYAQAMIELGALDAADALLSEALEAGVRSTDVQFTVELPEYRGLRGRIRKQRFVDTGALSFLSAATDEYAAQYSARKSYWHGINIVALRTKEEEDGLPPRSGETTIELAEQVLEIALAEHAKSSADSWPLATASEAFLALHGNGRGSALGEMAELWLYRFLNHPNPP